MPDIDDKKLESLLRGEQAAERLRELGERFGCDIHIARIVGKKRWAYVAGNTGCDMLSHPGKQLRLTPGFGAILYPRRPLGPDGLKTLEERLIAFLETMNNS